MKASNAFKESIKLHLEKRAAEDKLFAETYKKENKNLDECCNYIMQCAQKGGCAGYADEDVFGWAVHYYDEDDIKNIKPANGKVIVNHKVELTAEEIAEAKQKAIDNVVSQEQKRITQKVAKPIKKEEVAKPVQQVGLF